MHFPSDEKILKTQRAQRRDTEIAEKSALFLLKTFYLEFFSAFSAEVSPRPLRFKNFRRRPTADDDP
jgi:hypothetical protein